MAFNSQLRKRKRPKLFRIIPQFYRARNADVICTVPFVFWPWHRHKVTGSKLCGIHSQPRGDVRSCFHSAHGTEFREGMPLPNRVFLGAKDISASSSTRLSCSLAHWDRSCVLQLAITCHFRTTAKPTKRLSGHSYGVIIHRMAPLRVILRVVPMQLFPMQAIHERGAQTDERQAF